MNKLKHLLVALLMLPLAGMAQEIKIEDFQKLERDMSARTAKVKDVNGDLCALLKIETTEKGFEFSGCNIEKTEQKTGEIWLFASPGVKFITIKHKDFGVLRNYQFPQSIESGVVYQIKLSTEAKEVKIDTSTINKAVESKIDAKMEELNKKLALLEEMQKQSSSQKPKRIRPVYNKETFAMLNAAYSVAPQTSFGLTFGMQKTWGWYVSLASGLKFDALGATKEDADGTNDYFYDDNKTTSRLSIHGGAMYRIAKPLSIKLGVGYGVRNLAFTTQNSDCIKIPSASHSGLECSAGVHLSFGKMAFSVDVISIGFKYSELKLGIGYNFRIKEQKGE